MSENEEYPNNNRAVLTIAQIIKAIMSSATEANLGALYINSREAIPQRNPSKRDGTSSTSNTNSS